MRKCLSLVVCSFATASVLAAQVSAQSSIRGLVVRGSVSGSASALSFLYDVGSGADSGANITTLTVVLPSGYPGGLIEQVTSPAGWVGAANPANSLMIWASPNASGISPGGTVGGFGLTTGGLPGIVTIKARPYADANTVQITVPDNEGDVPAYLAQVRAALDQSSVSTLTVGPVPIPSPLDPVAFVATLGSYEATAHVQGWVSDATHLVIVNDLQAVNSALQTNARAVAKTVLRTMIATVNAESGRTLSAEAVGLLGINGQYLLDNTADGIVGDLNGDGVVNCTDLNIVKSAFGQRAGQAHFDIRADVNGDGLIDIRDLAAVSRAVPVGTVCR